MYAFGFLIIWVQFYLCPSAKNLLVLHPPFERRLEMINGYAICYKEWILDNSIKNELPLLLLISNLCAKVGYCYASNKYFADIFDCTEVSISTKIKKLEKKNYISIEYRKNGCQIAERKLRLKNILIGDSNIFESTIKKNFKVNNISNKNNNSNNTPKFIPENWQPSETTIAKLKKKGVIIDKAIDKFVNSCHAKGYKYVDFDRAILSWDWEKDGLVEKTSSLLFDDELRAKL